MTCPLVIVTCTQLQHLQQGCLLPEEAVKGGRNILVQTPSPTPYIHLLPWPTPLDSPLSPCPLPQPQEEQKRKNSAVLRNSREMSEVTQRRSVH